MSKQLDAKIKIREDTDEKVLAVLNGEMGMQPPIQQQHIERSHRLGRKGDGNGPHDPGAIRERAAAGDVYRARTKLKTHNAEHSDRQIYINEDLAAHREKSACKWHSPAEKRPNIKCAVDNQ